MRIPPSDLLNVAIEAAKASANHAMQNAQRRREVLKKSGRDITLKLDIECQQKAFNVIRSAFPAHDFIGEEQGHASGNLPVYQRTGYEWIIDPIDGTVNFSRGIPYWCSSVAVALDGRMNAGVVFAPALDLLYTATSESTSKLNDAPIQVSSTNRLSDALVCTSLTSSAKLAKASNDNEIAHLSKKVHGVRIFGSAALDLCNVAQGSIDVYHEPFISIWDVAAGGLIVEKAGGKTEILAEYSSTDFSFVGTNAFLHVDFVNFIHKVL
jgi:myo-inositol-1(or 4)-monophosphatase